MEKTLREEIAENLHHCPKNMQKINCGRKDCDKCRIDSILSLLQQAGWGNVAEARQQAQGELSGWIRCPHCGSGAIIWGKDRILLECTNCGNKSNYRNCRRSKQDGKDVKGRNCRESTSLS